MTERMKKYRKETLAARGARNVCFVAEKDDQQHLDVISEYLDCSRTEAIRIALKWAARDVREMK